MNKTLIALLTAASFLTLGAAQAAPMDKPAAESAKPAETAKPAKQLALAGLACLAFSFFLHHGGIGPIVKRLWTPAWVFFSGGCCLLILAALYQIIDVKQWRRWSFPFVVIGVNSLAMYVMRHTLDIWSSETLQRHFGTRVFQIFGAELQPVLMGANTFLMFWLVLLWMYRRKIYIRL